MSTHAGDWRAEALCREVDPELFFPEPDRQTTADAKRVCTGCPVRAECLADALARRDVSFGVLGGLPPRQRRQLLEAPATVASDLQHAGAA